MDVLQFRQTDVLGKKEYINKVRAHIESLKPFLMI